MAVLVATFGGSTESSLQSKTINKVELSPHDYTSCGFSSLLHHEVAIVKVEILTVFAEQKRIDPLLESVGLLIGTSIHEEILGS